MSSPSAPQAGPIPKLESVSLRNSIGKVSKPLGDITSTSPPNSAGKSKNTPAKRKYHTKSRKGCNTCKRRRVKCDEAKPICKKCDHMGIECSYALVALGKQSPSSSKSSSMEQPSILSPKSSIVSQNQPDSSNNYGSSTSRSPGYSSNNSNVFGQNLNSSITNAALQLLIANATNSITSAPSNNPLATLLSSGKNFVDIPALMGNGSFSGVPNNNTISTSSIQNSSNNINNIIADNGSMSSGNGLSTAELLLLQQLQQLQMQHALLLNLITGNGNSNANINANSSNLTSNNVGNSSNSNPLLSFLSSLTGNSASSAASLLNLANSNELYPGLNTLASQAEQQRKNSNPIIKTESMSSSIKLSNSNNDSILNGDDSMHHLVPPSPHSSNHSNNILSHGDSLTVPEDAKNMISTPSSTSSSIHGTSDNETINTSIPSSPKQSLFTSALPTFNSLDMRLMYHYTTQVWPTITAAGISEEKLWSEYIPKLAFNHPFLMHSVLAFSATHLSRTENGLDECVTTHRGEALRLLRDAVLEISLENTDALVASAIILIMDALANASLPSSPSPKSLPASAWIYHVKGAATILTAVWPLNKTSKFHKFISVDLSDLGDIINSPEKLADNDKTYSELSCFDDSIADLYPVEYSSPYLITLAYLDKLHNERYKSDFILRIFAFPALLDKTFLALLMTGDIAAMRIMRVYYSMLREFTNEMRDKVWFLEGVCKVLPADVDKYSGGGGMHMMLDFLGGGLPSLTTINLSDDFASNMETGFMSN